MGRFVYKNIVLGSFVEKLGAIRPAKKQQQKNQVPVPIYL